mmetsp:Transcript_35296/g.84617  ORF Transcript_35296/g.84617 Transcript_35296/m.84617 type:complete len:375 (+) Transcript_35296:1171-2295(+)
MQRSPCPLTLCLHPPHARDRSGTLYRHRAFIAVEPAGRIIAQGVGVWRIAAGEEADWLEVLGTTREAHPVAKGGVALAQDVLVFSCHLVIFLLPNRTMEEVQVRSSGGGHPSLFCIETTSWLAILIHHHGPTERVGSSGITLRRRGHEVPKYAEEGARQARFQRDCTSVRRRLNQRLDQVQHLIRILPAGHNLCKGGCRPFQLRRCRRDVVHILIQDVNHLLDCVRVRIQRQDVVQVVDQIRGICIFRVAEAVDDGLRQVFDWKTLHRHFRTGECSIGGVDLHEEEHRVVSAWFAQYEPWKLLGGDLLPIGVEHRVEWVALDELDVAEVVGQRQVCCHPIRRTQHPGRVHGRIHWRDLQTTTPGRQPSCFDHNV